MSITVDDLMKLARDLLAHSVEVSSRAAVSRAYYAAYHSCLALRSELPGARQARRVAHWELVREFREYDGASSGLRDHVQTLGSMLHQALGFRAKADYRLDEEFPKTDAEAVSKMCTRIINEAALAKTMLEKSSPR